MRLRSKSRFSASFNVIRRLHLLAVGLGGTRSVHVAAVSRVSRLSGSHVVPAALAVGALCSVGVGMGVANALPPSLPSDVMPLSEVKAGMKGYGLTVFSGTKPEKFDVEVISTLHNFRPHQDLILIKTPNHPRLDVARTVAGMSGSPIYLNGKMIGAYAYGWTFGAEAIAGVTPIQAMLDELARPLPKAIAPRGTAPMPGEISARPNRPKRAFLEAPEGYDLRRHAQQIATAVAPALAAPEGTSLTRASTPIMLGGMGASAVKIANELFAPLGLDAVQAGGGSSSHPEPDAPTKFVDGGAIGVEMIRGDISAMGLGTVTRVVGDKLLAFGHPMLEGGIENLPTAIGRVHWILASQNRSFKIGEAVRSVGALVNDRQAAIVVDTNAKAPTFPMHVEVAGVAGAPHPVWNLEVADDQFMAPAFTAMGIGSAVEATSSERRDMTWRAVTRLKIAKYGAITLTDFGAGNGSAPGPDDFVKSHVVRAMGALLNNPWEPVSIERVDSTVRITFDREVYQLRGAKVLEPEVDAGTPARIELELEPYLGKMEKRVIEVPIPVELAGRDVEIELAPGYDVERPLATPESVAQLLAMLPNQTFDPESVVATIRLRENGASFRGKVASRLPPGAIDTLRPSSASDAPETFVAQTQTAIPLKRFLVGKDTVRITIRSILK